MPTLARFDFGNSLTKVTPGYHKVGRVYVSPRYLWLHDVREEWREAEEDSPMATFVRDRMAEFRIGLPAGSYKLTFGFWDPKADHGAFDISFASIDPLTPEGQATTLPLLAQVTVPQGKQVFKVGEITHTGGALAIRFEAQPGQDFIINTLTVDGPATAQLEVMFSEAPIDILPTPAEVAERGSDDALAAFKQVANWLYDQRDEYGFLGDLEGKHQLWYTTAYPIRTFLAAYELLGEERYLAATTEILDRLVSEQMPNGAFTQAFRAQTSDTLTEADIEAIKAEYWMNLADVGSIVTALSAACKYVDDSRKATYVAACHRYFEEWALTFQHANGGFTNAWLAGMWAKSLYGIAAGTTCLALGTFDTAAGEQRYSEPASRGVRWLIEGWHEDGRPLSWPFDGQYPDKAYYQPVPAVGESFYTLDTLVSYLYQGQDQQLRKDVFQAMRKWLFGSQGLLTFWENQSWLPLDDSWHNSKSAGMPILLTSFLDLGPELGATQEELARIEKLLATSRRFICTPEFSQRIGVMLADPTELPWGVHSIQSWTGCAIAATGFAGIALAELIRPGVAYLQ